MSKEKNKKIGIRIASMLLDHFIMTFGMVIIGFILFGIIFLITNNVDSSKIPKWSGAILGFFAFLLFSVYFNKDAIKGKSPAKRILGLVIINNKTEKIASPIKCVVRNITIFMWPIEVIFTLFSPERRMGDYIAGTKVISDEKELETDLKIGQIIIALFIGQFLLLLMMLPQLMLSGMVDFFNYNP